MTPERCIAIPTQASPQPARSASFGSLFAGIGGFDLGLERAGLACRWQVEIDPSCRDILTWHFPEVDRHVDVREVNGAAIAPVDIITFGSPCQDLSVAGQRRGLDGARSILFYEATRIVREMRDATQGRCPTLIVWENVNGARSSNSGLDFGSVLNEVGDCGALDIAWRVLDSQWLGVAQRRERVFLVADFGGERAGEILALAQSLRWDSPPSRTAGQDVAGTLRGGATQRGWSGDLDGHGDIGPMPDISPTLVGGDGQGGTHGKQNGSDRGALIINALTARYAKGTDSDATDGLVLGVNGDVTHSLRAEGADAGEDGTGRGTPIVAVAPFDLAQITSQANRLNVDYDRESPPLNTGGQMHAVFGFSGESDGSTARNASDLARPITTRHGDPGFAAIAFTAKDHGADATDDLSPTLRSGEFDQSHMNGGVMPAVAFTERTRADGRNFETQEELAYALTNPGAGGRAHSRSLMQGMVVRRLTPTECERLQGFPDQWTSLGASGKRMSDAVRYRMLGNAVTVTVAHWIGRQIVAVLGTEAAD